MNNNPKKFIFNWIFYKQLAIGSAPREKNDRSFLSQKKIKSIFCLCSFQEFPSLEILQKEFEVRSFSLPDHKSKSKMSKDLIVEALKILCSLENHKPIFVHCNASIERSPIMVLAYLMFREGYEFNLALDYVMKVHPYTNPLSSQLAILKDLQDSQFKI
mgnify:CR=1 FL=1|tara:strand:- start:13878 stop:14354 length:477 start_codon:yes stop_codon:yes gene_type:complete